MTDGFVTGRFSRLWCPSLESLFSNAPIEGAGEAARRKLDDTNTYSDVDRLDFVFRSTCFQYNGSIYKQLEVAAMGSPQ